MNIKCKQNRLKTYQERKLCKINGFTLAEALITIGIIGVVSVLIWGVLKGYLGSQYITSAKVMYANFLGAYESVEADIGPINNWDMISGGYTTDNFFVQNFAPKMHVAKICYQDDYTCTAHNLPQPYGLTFLLENGSTLNFMTYAGRNFYLIEMDTNGAKGPNITGIDKFFFGINNHGLDSIADSPYKDIQGIVIPGKELDNPGCRRNSPDNFPHWPLIIAGQAVPDDSCLALLLKTNWDTETYAIKDYSMSD